MEDVLREWSILLSTVKAIVTDNASTVVKAFRREVELTIEDSSNDESDDGNDALQFGGDEEDFETRELNHEVTFRSFCKCLSCFAHHLLL